MSTLGLGLGSALAPLGVPGTTSFDPTYSGDLADGLGVAEVTGPGIAPPALTDTFGAHDEPYRAYGATASDTLGTSAALVFGWGKLIEDQLRLNQAEAVGSNLVPVLADVARLSPALTASWLIALAETLGFSPNHVVARAATVVDALQLEPAVLGSWIIGLTLTEQLQLVDSLGNFFGGELLDGLGMETTFLPTKVMTPEATDGLGFAEALGRSLVIRLVAADTLSLDDVNALQLLFSPELTDGIEIAAAYLSPGDSITTWAVNTRTGAVTEYSNYAFNSFARLGNNYIGASSTGLYELLGDDDDGTSIVARIKSGFAQFTGTRFSSFKAAYLGVRGEGDFVLRLETGEGQTYDYAVSTRDMRSTKVHMGKGLRARYFSFELISTGQDFDLDSVEFVPISAERRV